MKKTLVCISCPVGCRLTVSTEEDGSLCVTGNLCARGEEYGREEALSPKRVVTATAPIDSSTRHRIPVKTDGFLPREMINGLLTEIYRLTVAPPVEAGDVLIKNFKESGINVVATRSIRE